MSKRKKQKVKCPICGVPVQNPNSKRHVNSQNHQKALNKEDATQVATAVSKSPSGNIESRVISLENQVAYIIKKIDNLELHFLKNRKDTISSDPRNEIKRFLSQNLTPGDSLSVDELQNKNELSNFNWSSIEKAILRLVDEEILDITEGSSKRKIEGKYGRLILR